MATVDLLVVGGTGLLGRALVAAARTAGQTVVATHHRRAPGRVDVEWRALDLTAVDTIAPLVAELAPAATINAAYAPGGHDLGPVTAEAPGHLAAAVAGVEGRFLHVSSDVVFAGDTGRPRAESDPVGPITDYGRAKLAAEQAVASADRSAAIVRTSLLWSGSPDGHQERLVADPTVSFFTNQIRCPLRVDRLAEALLELADRSDVSGPLHVAGADAVDRLTLARALAPALGVDPVTLDGTVDRSGTRPDQLVLDSARARGLLDTALPGLSADAP